MPKIAFSNEGNLPISILSTKHKLGSSVGDDTEDPLWDPAMLRDPEYRRALSERLVKERWAFANQGAAARYRQRGEGHVPIAGGDQLPGILINDESPINRLPPGGYNNLAMRRSVMTARDDRNF